MDEKIKKVLQENETVLWIGQPLRFSTANRSNWKTKLLPPLLIAVLTLGVISAFLFLSPDPRPLFMAVFFLVGFFLFLLPFAEAASIRRVDYVITDQRVLSLTGEHVNASLPRNKRGDPKIVREPEGGYSLLIGSAVECPQKLHRRKADEGIMNNDEEDVTGILFYNLSKEDCDQALDMLGTGPLAFAPAPEPRQRQVRSA